MDQITMDRIAEAHRSASMILPNGQLYCMDTMRTRLNNNVIILGTSGSNKTRSTVIPNILSCVGSYIVTDPKGNLYDRYGAYMREQGYQVRHLDLIHPERSDHYNPLRYIHSTNDILKLSNQIVYAGPSMARSNDPFWERASEMLLSAMIGYILEGGKEVTPNLHGVIRMLSNIDTDKLSSGRECELDRMFRRLREQRAEAGEEESWAYQQYQKFRNTPPKTYDCVIITLQAILGGLDTKEIREMMREDVFDLPSIGSEKTIVFVEISDTDRSKDTLANIFYSQAMNELCSWADEVCPNSALEIPVRFILDDFGTNCRIDGFQNMISNIRSRNISAMLILQSESQLMAGYGDSAHTIMDNCDTLVYTGGNDVETAAMISKRSDRSLRQILYMPVGTNWLFRRGQQPLFSRTVDLSEYVHGMIGISHQSKAV